MLFLSCLFCDNQEYLFMSDIHKFLTLSKSFIMDIEKILEETFYTIIYYKVEIQFMQGNWEIFHWF